MFQKADIGAAALSIVPHREEKVDFAFPYYINYVTAMYKEPALTSKVSITYFPSQNRI